MLGQVVEDGVHDALLDDDVGDVLGNTPSQEFLALAEGTPCSSQGLLLHQLHGGVVATRNVTVDQLFDFLGTGHLAPFFIDLCSRK